MGFVGFFLTPLGLIFVPNLMKILCDLSFTTFCLIESL